MRKTLSKIAIVLSLIVLSSYASFANFPFSVGPFIGLKGGVNASGVPEGIQNGFTLNSTPEMGVTGYIPFADETKFGGLVELAYLTDGFSMKPYQGNKDTTHQHHYFNFSPSIFAEGFVLGFNFCFPMGGTLSYDDNETEVDADDMATLIEVRLGGRICVYANDFGRFNIVINGSYALNGLGDEEYADGYNYHPGQLWVGFNYMFNLTKPKGKEFSH